MLSPDIMQKALGLIRKRAANYEYFFDHLDSPVWIEPLYSEGFFRTPPPPEHRGGYVHFPRWPESEYLARMARIPEAQEQVVAIALAIPDTHNARVHEDLADIALSLPPSLAAKFVHKARKWLRARYLFRLPEKLGALMAHLAQGGQTKEAIDLARELLAVVPDHGDDRGQEDDELFYLAPPARPRFDEWQYEEIVKKHVPSLVDAAGERALDMLCDVLEDAVRMSGGTETEGRLLDHSSVWRPAIEDHEQNQPHEFMGLLVTAVRDAAERLVRRGSADVGSLVRLFEARRWPIFRRLALYLLRCFPDAAPQLVVERLTDRSWFDAPELHHEYVLLARDFFDRLQDKEQETILGWIAEGPDLEAWKGQREQNTGQRPSDQEAQRYKRAWQRDRLAPLAHALPPHWKRYYDDLVRELGPAEHPEFLIYSYGTWVGPTSPKSADELRALGLGGILDYLKTWEPPGSWDSPSPEGLGRTLAGLVASDPKPFAEAAPCFQGLDPTYVRHLLSGLRDAAHNGRSFPWPPVVALAQWVVAQERDIPGRGSEHSDRDPGWAWTRGTIADLLSVGLKAGPAEIPFDLRDEVWSILRPLTDDPDPTPEREAQYTRSNMDPATLSINTVRGKAMHAVVGYALWVRWHLQVHPGQAEVGDGLDEMPEVRDVLELHLDPSRDPSLAVRAVYGWWFPALVLLDARWAAAHVHAIFPPTPDHAPLRQASWNAYLIFNNPSDAVFAILRSVYMWAVGHIDYTAGSGGSHLRPPAQRLAEHLMQLYWAGMLALEEPGGLLDRFFMEADDMVRSHAIAFVGRALYKTEGNIPLLVVERLQALWERRIAAAKVTNDPSRFCQELASFGWWFVSQKFDEPWALSQLAAVLHIVHAVKPHHLVVKRLAEVAAEYPVEAIRCLSLMVEENVEGWRIAASMNELRSILAAALAGSDPAARSAAEDLIHRLGARGYREFRNLLHRT